MRIRSVDHPFDPDWARALYQEFKDMHWDSFRFHVGFAPDIWYDIADEEGMLIMDEYAVFGVAAPMAAPRKPSRRKSSPGWMNGAIIRL